MLSIKLLIVLFLCMNFVRCCFDICEHSYLEYKSEDIENVEMCCTSGCNLCIDILNVNQVLKNFPNIKTLNIFGCRSVSQNPTFIINGCGLKGLEHEGLCNVYLQLK